jgi:transcriptional regulator with XRE-family HTH domain
MDQAAFQREFGRRLRRKRQMMGWSQRELAQRVGMPQGQLSRIERGDFQLIQLWLVRQLLEALRTSPDFLFGYSDDPGEVPLSDYIGAAPSLAG